MKIKESDLAKEFIDSFDESKYEIFQEVETPNGTTDIVLKYNFIWAIEAKLGMSLTVIAQARYNLRWFDYSSICLPYKSSNGKTFNFGSELCKKFGIGIFLVRKNEVRETVKAKIQRNRNNKYIVLHEKQKTFAAAGNSDGYRWTPFNNTVDELERFVKKNPGCKLKDALNHISHHYSSLSSAQCSIRTWINKGVIKTISIDRGKLNLIGVPNV